MEDAVPMSSIMYTNITFPNFTVISSSNFDYSDLTARNAAAVWRNKKVLSKTATILIGLTVN